MGASRVAVLSERIERTGGEGGREEGWGYCLTQFVLKLAPFGCGRIKVVIHKNMRNSCASVCACVRACVRVCVCASP